MAAIIKKGLGVQPQIKELEARGSTMVRVHASKEGANGKKWKTNSVWINPTCLVLCLTGEVLLVAPSAKEIWLAGTRKRLRSR